jgi:sigma-B regulation protein RsbU (phosphoserine phosphatase)
MKSSRSDPGAILCPGDVLILYTDGVIEPENADGEQFSIARFVDIARANMTRSAQELVQAIHSAVIAFTGRQERSDDLTLVVLKVLPEGGPIESGHLQDRR